MIKKSKNVSVCLVVIACCIAMYPRSAVAQCPESDNAIGTGKLAISLFYAAETYQDDRQQLGVSTNDLSLDEIVPVTDDSVCNQIEEHIMASDQYHETTKNQAKVYFKNEQTGRYFFVSYEDPLRSLGWTTGVYILDENFNKLGGFGV